MRPTKFNDDLSSTICLRIANGETVREICRDAGMPSKATLFRWLADPTMGTFRDQYSMALEVRAEMLAEEILQIADDGANDFIEKQLKSGEVTYVYDAERMQRSRLRVDTRKWLLARLLPKKYGDRVGRDENGVTDGDPVDYRQQLDRKLARLASKGRKGTVAPESDGEGG